MIDLVLHNRTTQRAFSRAFVLRVCNAAESHLKIPKRHRAEVGIVFVGPAAMRTLNRTRRKVDTSTDVLSFPLHMKPITGYTAILLGDLFICPSVVRAKAVQSGQSVQSQMAWTIAHGLLHLAGYTHIAMRPHEQRILKSLHL
jgi:probable rRNA maturation factor